MAMAATPRRITLGVMTSAAVFVGLGTVAALWDNPLFVRMTPSGPLEVVLLALMAVLMGIYVAIRRPACRARVAGAGGVLNFLGVACPICNKVLVLLFGGQLLMSYFEPVRVYVAGAGAALVAAAILAELARQRAVLQAA